MLSVVIPAYNEEKRLPATLAELRKRPVPGECEIIVVDDGSTDGTATIAEKTCCRVIRQPVNSGKGAAVKAGVLAARGDLILVTDADLATPLTELPKLLAALETGADIAIGSRAAPGARVRRASLNRKAAGKIFVFLVRFLNGLKYGDTQCGFKLFKGEAARAVFSSVDCRGYAYDVEALVLAGKMGFAVREVGVSWEDRHGSKVKLLRDSLRMLKELLEIRKRFNESCSPVITGTSAPESAPSSAS
ncbi:MAG: glycosyltransferase family 2 protein [Firmicutes bacterium]|nr:glycosyltransferase family 2 protein [Bacillota bacterium]